ncbi:ribbon-helix-helix protein, CopG family [Notoacmeibacter ruber]|nr:ribbon-helix-helix protein, CopG family [Notoacmeibacter ruber]
MNANDNVAMAGTISVRLPWDVFSKIDTMAKEEDRSRSNIARRLLLKAVNGEEPDVPVSPALHP